VTLLASFSDDASAQAAYDDLKDEYTVRLDALVGDAWRDAWKEHWQPTRITPRVVVVPSWLTYDPAPGEIALKLDPGRAFGTGQHPSTALAARAIERHVADGAHPLLLDVGCGSGILSFVALLEGLARVIACDTDEESVTYTRENAQALGLAERADIRHGDVAVISETASLVVANIETPVLVPMAPALAARVTAGGALVLSGILVEQREAIVQAYTAQGLTLERADTEGAWIAPEFRRPV
jgi:ribosomal protein L11 methyltransferase